jgi:nucleoside-diphosphate-sugar epimerase
MTGATGFIGGHLARQLRAAGHDVVATVRSRARAGELAELGVELHEGDVTDKESMRAAMAGVDGAFHVAGWYRVGARDTAPADAVNVRGTRNVLELVRELGIPKAVYTSTIAVFGDTKGRVVDEGFRHDGPHLSAYDRTKWRAHYEIAEPMIRAGLPLMIVQPGLVYGPGDRSSVHDTLVRYVQGNLPAVPGGSACCWAHVDDTARAHVLAMEKGRLGQSYVVGGPVHTLVEALRIAERITGVPAPRVVVPPGVLRGASALVGLLERWVHLKVPDTYTSEGLRVTAGTTYTATDDKARRELGFAPRPLEEGLRETLLHEMRQLRMAPSL